MGDVKDVCFRNPDNFKAGALHDHYSFWQEISYVLPLEKQSEILGWIKNRVSVQPYFQPYKGRFKGELYNSDRPPRKRFPNNKSCQPFACFVRTTLLDRLKTGAISLLGRVGRVRPPHLVLPLTVEPLKPRLCHDARYLNLWMRDMPFSLDNLSDLPRYVGKYHYQTVLDDKSGYDHILLTEDILYQFSGWYFVYNTLPFGWKISPYVYHTGLLPTTFLRSIGIPCLLYIDDRHNGPLQVPLDSGQYASLTTADDKNLAAAKSGIFLATFYLVRLGYFLGLKKSILFPRKIVPYLGFCADSERQVFHLLPDKKEKFLTLVREILRLSHIPLKTLQRLVGKCVSFSMVVPAARLYTREMNLAISKNHLGKGKHIAVEGRLQEEIIHWLFLESFDDPLPWRDERRVRVSLATDASNSGWAGQLLYPVHQEVSDYWTAHEHNWDLATKEAAAIDKVLQAFRPHILNARVDVMVDNQAVIHAWNNQGSRSPQLNVALKRLFFTTVELNVSLHFT
jgi:hypothetical protein